MSTELPDRYEPGTFPPGYLQGDDLPDDFLKTLPDDYLADALLAVIPPIARHAFFLKNGMLKQRVEALYKVIPKDPRAVQKYTELIKDELKDFVTEWVWFIHQTKD